MFQSKSRKASFTIVNNAYFQFALTLAESFTSLHKDYDFYIFLLDERADEINLPPGVEVVEVNQKLIPDLLHRAFYYEITELSTSIKPNIILNLFEDNYELVAYIDPDIYFYSQMREVEIALEKYNFVLIPHTIKPIYDGKRPDDLTFMRAGAYNLGFIALKKCDETIAMLQWWAERLIYNSFSSFSIGMFTDQKWMDLSLAYFEGGFILKHPGYNVAYWNLHERSIDCIDGSYTSNGQNLVFFHFSGINMDGNSISKYQTRFQSYPNQAIEKIFKNYILIVRDNLKYSKFLITSKYFQYYDGRDILESDRLLFFHILMNTRDLNINPFEMSTELINYYISHIQLRNQSIFSYDNRIVKLSARLSKMPVSLRRAVLKALGNKNLSSLLRLTNNSVNKINLSYIFFRLFK